MVENTYSFNDVPRALTEIRQEMADLKRMLLDFQKPSQSEEDRWMYIEEVREYIPFHPAEQTVYGWTSENQIPFHKIKKNLFFRKSEIDDWLMNKKRKADYEIQREAEAYVAHNRRRM